MELHQCPECNGCGELTSLDGNVTPQACANCDGIGWLDEHGEPLYLEPEVKELTNENK
jgi:hypothetical protein